MEGSMVQVHCELLEPLTFALPLSRNCELQIPPPLSSVSLNTASLMPSRRMHVVWFVCSQHMFPVLCATVPDI